MPDCVDIVTITLKSNILLYKNILTDSLKYSMCPHWPSWPVTWSVSLMEQLTT